VKREKVRALQKELPGCNGYLYDVGSFQNKYLNELRELWGSITLTPFATFLDFN